ncbi:LysR family transcriptional regulator [Megasphaera sp. DISK 18]|uniref:LysR family transcriptional regulator n=1 Tax=Megasphaera sp. DISK 18 TaxID=1776081 RepID=UPI001C3FF660|nr:LysR family transcriptional regulator [Megasphaera sp. DISK 18]
MMDIQNLQTFLAVAKLGSFTKAAEQNFISPTAVMKQINKLESELDCTLLERSSAGIRLKPEGEVFLTYAQQLIELSHEAYLACHKATNQAFTLRLGTSLLHPSRPFLSIWNRIKDKLPQYSLTIVQLPSDLVTQNREYEALGKTCDILIGTFDQATTHTLVDAVPLGSYRFSIAVRSDNPLAEKDLLAIKDLEHQHLLMVPKGISHKNDLLRAQMEKELAHCQILETPGRYSLDTFNVAIDKNAALINLTPWEDIHPGLISIPLATDITVDYGILAAKDAPSRVKEFLSTIRYQLLTQMGEYGPVTPVEENP